MNAVAVQPKTSSSACQQFFLAAAASVAGKNIERCNGKTILDVFSDIERARPATSRMVLENARPMFFYEQQGG